MKIKSFTVLLLFKIKIGQQDGVLFGMDENKGNRRVVQDRLSLYILTTSRIKTLLNYVHFHTDTIKPYTNTPTLPP